MEEVTCLTVSIQMFAYGTYGLPDMEEVTGLTVSIHLDSDGFRWIRMDSDGYVKNTGLLTYPSESI